MQTSPSISQQLLHITLNVTKYKGKKFPTSREIHMPICKIKFSTFQETYICKQWY